MHFSHVRRVALLGVLSVGLAACGDDSTGPDDALTDTEFEAMMEAFALIGFDFTEMTATGGSGAVSLTETVPCPQGGNVAVTLAGFDDSGLDPETGLGTLAMTMVYAHQGCRATAPSSGMQFTFDGDPDVTVDLEMTLGETTFAFSGAQQGAVRWATGERGGRCSVDLAFDFRAGGEGEMTGSVTGTACGRPVSETL